MYNSLKLYADNLLCMDLCCWSNAEAVDLLGSEVSSIRCVYSLTEEMCVCVSTADGAPFAEEERHERDLGLSAHGRGQTW